MKNTACFLIMLATFDLLAQNTFPSSGNVGIGTTSPNAKLELSDTGTPRLQMSRTAGHGSLAPLGQIDFYEGYYDQAISSRIEGTRGPGTSGRGELVFSTLQVTGGSLSERMRITYTGDVGIGTATPGVFNINPSYQVFGPNDLVFDVQGGNNTGWLSTGSNIDNGILGGIVFTKPNGQSDAHRQVAYIRVKTEQSTYNTLRSTLEFATKGSGYIGQPDLVIVPSGNVGIGTEDPDELLTVNGSIHSKEVKVDLSVPGPDYVFEDDYNLLSLKEIEQYIRTEKHLPEIPPAREMEANGVELGVMNMLLLKKIEELTLHQIELLKRIEELEKSK